MINISPSHPIFAIIIYFIAYFTGYILYTKSKTKTISGRYETIDGLRGFLALGVFIHHAYIWYFLLHGAGWQNPESHLYNQLGKSSVALFFMITSFLFVSKLLNTKEKPFDWAYFFISRICRLAPMYYVSIGIIAFIVMYLSDWTWNVSAIEYLTSLFHFAAFTITTAPLLNACEETLRINAGVIWSLPFEWLFYFTLPLIGLLLLKKKPALIFITISIAFVLLFTVVHGIKLNHIASFAGGMIAPFLMKHPAIVKISKSVYSSFAVLICLFSIALFPSADDVRCKLFIIALFTLVALGNTVFGILKSNILKFLGEMAYSTYLLHGIVLFSVIRLGFGVEKVKQFSEFEYAVLIFSITPIVVLLSFLGFKYVEKPFMNQSKTISRYFQPNK